MRCVARTDTSSSVIDPTNGEIVARPTTALTDEALAKEERIEDLHIDGQLETIHNSAMGAFEQQARLAQEVDPRFSARNAEVAAQYLNIALNSVNSRVDAKFKRNKIKLAKDGAGSPTTVNQNIIVADRNAVLRALMTQEPKQIEGEVVPQ